MHFKTIAKVLFKIFYNLIDLGSFSSITSEKKHPNLLKHLQIFEILFSFNISFVFLNSKKMVIWLDI